ncbi:MAG: 2,3-bisphosphoglycerate-independent phosphoglycerate mutase [Rickettsiales bacterium]|nr:2,3-bisphosphoglycerate-independent phosphoglycerate mutase [Rickettsiales bacterium]
MKKTFLLCILDGFGETEKTKYNAIANANTPNWDYIKKTYPISYLKTSGLAVGLPEGQMGNSEVGHMNIGAGRVMLQLLPRINKAITENNVDKREEFKLFIKKLQDSGGVCHLFGMLSDGGVHGHMDHVIYLAKTIAEYGLKVDLHCFMDGRDAPPQSGCGYLANLLENIKDVKGVRLASIVGRYYAMDRDLNWDRVKKAYDAYILGDAKKTNDFMKSLEESYSRNEYDEFVKPIISADFTAIKDGDGFFVANYRADRVRQLITMFLDNDFSKVSRENINFSALIGIAEYSKEISEYLPALFPTEFPKNVLADVFEAKLFKQLHIAETEKYAHVTFFFNGGVEAPKNGEERVLVPSPKVRTYDLEPAMAADLVTDNLLEAIKSGKYEFIVVNYANPDMVGHTGVYDAALNAVEKIDEILGKLSKAILAVDGQMIITADHGNIEEMFDEDINQPHTAHSMNPVPFSVINSRQDFSLENGGLCDVAPTILDLLDIEKPEDMTGKSLLLKD